LNRPKTLPITCRAESNKFDNTNQITNKVSLFVKRHNLCKCVSKTTADVGLVIAIILNVLLEFVDINTLFSCRPSKLCWF